MNSEDGTVQESAPANELQQREETKKIMLESEIEQRQAEKKKEQLNMLISALEKGIVSKEQYDVDFADLKRRYDELEIFVKKARAQGLANIKSNEETAHDQLKKLYPGLAEKGYL